MLPSNRISQQAIIQQQTKMAWVFSIQRGLDGQISQVVAVQRPESELPYTPAGSGSLQTAERVVMAR